VLEAVREKDRIALSMKALEADPWAAAAQRFVSGAEFEGKVARKADFGVFIELESGVDGLLHVSQLPPGMTIADPMLAPGNTVKGWIKECDVDRRRISLSLRELASGDPWLDAASRYPVGTLVDGVVERTAAFGVFVEIEPGITGLIPASESDTPRGGDLASSFAPGAKVAATVLSVDTARKRMSLSLKKAKDSKASKEFRKWAEEKQAPRKAELSAFGAALQKALQGKPDEK
jgi:small subunit ribosomal protein S1